MITHDANKRFKFTGLHLPPAPEPKGLYNPCLITEKRILFFSCGKFMYLSGHLPVQIDGALIKGRIGQDINKDEGKLAARQVGLTMISTIWKNLHTLNKVKRVVKLFGMVNCIPEFTQHPYIIDGCSELFAEVFGAKNGVGTRSAIGVCSLPENVPVEIEGVFELF